MQKTIYYTILVLFGLILANSRVYAINDDILYDFVETTFNGSQLGKSGNTFTHNVALHFVPQNNYLYCGVKVLIHKTGNPIDSVRVRLYSFDSFNNSTNGGITGTLIDSPSAFLGSGLATSSLDMTLTDFPFTNCLFLNKYHNYALLFDRTGTYSDTNFYLIGRTTTSFATYADGYGFVPVQNWTQYTNGQEVMVQLYGISDISFFDEPSSASYGFTDSDFGWFGNMLVDILKYLFVPSQQALNNFNQLANDLMLKPPFAYFTAIKDAISGLQNGTATETLDISPIQALITPIRTGFIWILWFAFAFWLLKRFMHIQL